MNARVRFTQPRFGPARLRTGVEVSVKALGDRLPYRVCYRLKSKVRRCLADQQQEIGRLVAELERLDPDTDWPASCREFLGVSSWNMVTRTMAGMLLDWLRKLVDG